MTSEFEPLPSNLAAAHAMILAERNARVMAEADAAVVKAEAANAQADLSSSEALNAYLKLEIEKLRRELYGSRSERKARLLEQMELQLEDLETAATEDELAAETTAVRTQAVQSFQRKRPSRKPFTDHLPRERIVIAAPESCPCCGSAKLSKLGEDITETLEVMPRQWKVIQTVREKFSCRTCETITQPPAPFHVTPRGFAGPNLLAMILFEKFGQHQPLNRQSERYRREGIDLSVSTLADQVGACTTALQPLHALIERHVLAAERLHGAASRRRRSRQSVSNRASAATPCSISNGGSTAKAPKSVCEYAGSRVRPLWRRWKHGCGSSGCVSRARPRSPNPSIICCGAGIGLPSSSTMAGSA